MTRKMFKCGDRVPTSGVYQVFHSSPHSMVGREIYFEGSRFPECGSCSGRALYQLESPCAPIQASMPALLAITAC